MVVVIESSILISEVERYLGVVEYFRAEGCELQWTAEPTPSPDEVSARLAVPRTLRR